jgi:hypothetical protein
MAVAQIHSRSSRQSRQRLGQHIREEGLTLLGH